jgi:uncharacterized damage-inducible protein DinB
MLDEIRTLYAYSAWANRRVLDTAERMPLQQFIAANGGAESIREILTHMVWAQWLWLERWQGRSPQALWHPGEFPYVASLRARAEEVDAATQRFLDGLDEPDLARVITYVNGKGETWAYPLWAMLLHQANHATQHRSEAALLLTRAGHSPGDLDLLVYVDAMAGA